jgi:thioester reductase-like protein
VLLTGATGFLGMEVLARLLERTDHEVVCVVRGDADARLEEVLATLYSDGTPHRDRVQAIAGDLTGDVAAPGPVDVVCHCAASISFDLPLDEARAINVEGTRAVLRLAREAGAGRLADGVGMLVEQAAEAFLWWRGVRPDTRATIEAVAVPLA